jgi:perosamine synthetase
MTWKVPQVMPWLGAEEAAAAAKAVQENWITEGPRCKEFSDNLLALTGAPYGVFAPNGTLALVLGLMALGVKAGDEVLVPDITFIGSANAAVMVGATPVFVEVNRSNFQLDVGCAEKLVTPRTRAIMPVHLFGMSCNMDQVEAFARRHGLLVIEDAAQGIGVSYRGRHLGTIGDVGCFSFFADKTITTGEGGYVTCRDERVYNQLRLLRNQGRLDRGSFTHPAIGYNFRITDMQAAVGLVQLAKLDEIKRRKTNHLNHYLDGLKGLDCVRFLGLEPGSGYVPFRCVIMCERLNELVAFLEAAGIQTRGFFYPLHRQPCFADLPSLLAAGVSLEDRDYPNAVHGYSHGLCLPISPGLTDRDVGLVIASIRRFYERERRAELSP